MYIQLTISSCYGSTPLTLGLIGGDGGFSTLFHSCRFACQQRVLKRFPGLGYLRSEDEVVWLWHLLVNLHTSYICIYKYNYMYIYIYIYQSRNYSGGGGEVSPTLFQHLKKSALILGKNDPTMFICGFNFSFKMLF